MPANGTGQRNAGRLPSWRRQSKRRTPTYPEADDFFHSGGPFLYPSSTSADYASLVAAGSKGRAVWRMGLGPDKHPSYVGISIDPQRIIDSQYVAKFSANRDLPSDGLGHERR